MLIAWDNKVDAAVVDAGSEITSLPGANVQHPHLSKKWHTAAGVESSHIVFDMGSAVTCAVLAVLGTNLTAAATLRLRADTTEAGLTSSPDLDTGTISAGVKAGYGAAYKVFAETSLRWWRLDLTDTTVPENNLQIGRIVLAPYWQPSVNMQLGWSVTPLDESPRVTTRGGQTYPDVLPKRRVLRFTLDFMDQTEMFTNAFAMARANGVVKDVLAIPDITGAFLSEQAVWGLMSASEPLIEEKLALFKQRFQIEESL